MLLLRRSVVLSFGDPLVISGRIMDSDRVAVSDSVLVVVLA